MVAPVVSNERGEGTALAVKNAALLFLGRSDRCDWCDWTGGRDA